MLRTIFLFVVGCFFYLSTIAQTLQLIPQPNKVQFTKGALHLQVPVGVSTKGLDAGSVDFLKSQLTTELNSDSKGQIKLEIIKGEANEAYQLVVSKRGVVIKATTSKGLFYGIASLNQILFQTKKEKGYTIPCVHITDQPAYTYRGFMLDASRHFQSVEKVKQVLDFMASIKLNVFHWHLSDDQGWRIESKKFPRLNQVSSYINIVGSFQDADKLENNGFYTQAEIKDILAYAAQRNIQVIPEVDIPGHSWAILTAYPEFRCPNHPASNAFCGANEEGIAFIKALFDEVIELFQSPYVHIGGDERKRGLWKTCPLDIAKMEKLGIKDEHDLQNHFLNEITQYIHSKGVTTIAWADNLKGGIPEGQITQEWHGGEGPMALEKGHQVIVSDHMYNYLDYPANAEEKKTKPGWMPVLSVETLYNFDFTYEGISEEKKAMILGGECPLWTEEIMEKDIYPQIHERIEAHAERSWTKVESKDLERFRKAYSKLKAYFQNIIGD